MRSQQLGKLLISAAAGLAVTGGLLFATAQGAYAAFMLELSDGTTTQAIIDGGGGDIAAGTGEIRYSGNIGNFVINLTTGESKPSLGSISKPEMQLSSVDVSSGDGGILTIKLTDTDFVTASTLTNWVTTIAGASTGALSLEAYVNTDNAAFSTQQLVASLGPLSGFFNDLSEVAIVNPSGPFSVTLIATVAHGGGWQATGFRANVSDPPFTPPGAAIPEPTALALFGIGLVGLGFMARRRRQETPEGRRRA